VRARLSADGKLHTCLFSARGRDLRPLLRSGAPDGELIGALAATWARRGDRYSELRAEGSARRGDRIEMWAIGG
jgi:cyclic pyranopterin phosphate synthase